MHTGDSAIATLGSSDMIFGTEPTYPNRIGSDTLSILRAVRFANPKSVTVSVIARNHIREVGICTLLYRRHPPNRPSCLILRLRQTESKRAATSKRWRPTSASSTICATTVHALVRPLNCF